jgi:hypothetical protein
MRRNLRRRNGNRRYGPQTFRKRIDASQCGLIYRWRCSRFRLGRRNIRPYRCKHAMRRHDRWGQHRISWSWFDGNRRDGRHKFRCSKHWLGQHGLIKGQMEGRSLQCALGISIPPRNIAQWELPHVRAGVQRVGDRLNRRRLLAVCRHARVVFRSQNFVSLQIFIGVDVAGLLGLLLARAFLTRRFGNVLLRVRAALLRAEKQARANQNRQTAAQRRS